jgi:hypothetical protein
MAQYYKYIEGTHVHFFKKSENGVLHLNTTTVIMNVIKHSEFIDVAEEISKDEFERARLEIETQMNII